MRTELYFDVDYLVRAEHAYIYQIISNENLSKIWRITVNEAAKTLEKINQDKVHTEDLKVDKNYGTNNRILKYNKIKEYFYMDTLIATYKGGNYLRGNTCRQIFVTDK